MIEIMVVVAVGCLGLARLLRYLARDPAPHVSDAWLRALYRERRD